MASVATPCRTPPVLPKARTSSGVRSPRPTGARFSIRQRRVELAALRRSFLAYLRSKMTDPRLHQHRSLYVGAAILVAALALRVALIQTARFTGDEVREYAIRIGHAKGQQVPL